MQQALELHSVWPGQGVKPSREFLDLVRVVHLVCDPAFASATFRDAGFFKPVPHPGELFFNYSRARGVQELKGVADVGRKPSQGGVSSATSAWRSPSLTLAASTLKRSMLDGYLDSIGPLMKLACSLCHNPGPLRLVSRRSGNPFWALHSNSFSTAW